MSNTAIWDALGKTDPAHTKQFQRSGGFKGTALKPMWMNKRLTEHFGPVGTGWGMGEPSFQVVPGHEGEVMVYCTVACWASNPQNVFYGVGGDKVVGKNKYGLQSDDEAFKKAYTDAIGNAFKFLGVGADIHMGQFDDSKYVEQVAREFEQEKRPAKRENWDTPIPNKSQLHKALTRLERELAGCGDSDMVYALTATQEWRDFVVTAEKHAPHYLRGGDPAPPEFEGLQNTAERMVREFDAAEANHMVDLARA